MPSILIADDEMVVVDAVKLKLTKYFESVESPSADNKLNIEFYTAVSFDEMTEIIRKNTVDVLILDLSIPLSGSLEVPSAGMSLIKLARQITNAGIIVYSGNDPMEYEFQCLQSGADYYVPKTSLRSDYSSGDYLTLYTHKLLDQSLLRKNIIARRNLFKSKTFKFGACTFTVGELVLKIDGEKDITLSVSEHDFLVLLFSSNKGRVTKLDYRRYILNEQKWQSGKELSEVVRRLRKRLPNSIDIRNIHDVGYELNIAFKLLN